jgi:hypothetical protein
MAPAGTRLKAPVEASKKAIVPRAAPAKIAGLGEAMKLSVLVCVGITLAGCASKSENIAAAYVSPLTYQPYTCDQLRLEATRVSSRAIALSGAQDSKATGDAVATGVAIVIFWPAAFLIKGDGATGAELARLKGEMEAIEQSSVQKKCGIEFKRTAA